MRIRAIVVSVEGLCTVTFLLAIVFVPMVGAYKHFHFNVVCHGDHLSQLYMYVHVISAILINVK